MRPNVMRVKRAVEGFDEMVAKPGTNIVTLPSTMSCMASRSRGPNGKVLVGLCKYLALLRFFLNGIDTVTMLHACIINGARCAYYHSRVSVPCNRWAFDCRCARDASMPHPPIVMIGLDYCDTVNASTRSQAQLLSKLAIFPVISR